MATAVGRLTRQLSEERASILAHEATALFHEGQLERASRKLREAAALGHDNADVQAAFVTLHSGQPTDPLIDFCRRYAQFHDPRAGESAVQYLHDHDASQVVESALDCVKLVLESSSAQLSDAQNTIIAELARLSRAVRTYFATELIASTTEFFDNVYYRGDDAANCLRTVVLDSKLWPNEETRLRVEDDLFQLFLAKLMESGHDHDGRALKGIALLLLADTQRLHYFIDEDAAEAILTSLDFRLSADVRGRATLIYSKFIEVSETMAQAYFVHFINTRITKQKGDDLVRAFAAATALFPVAPTVVSQLFLTDNLLPSIMPLLYKRFSSTLVQDSFLSLLNAACIDTTCRTAINKNCASWLSHLVSNGAGKQPAMAATILAKLRTSGIKAADQRASMADHDVSDLVNVLQKSLTTQGDKNMSDSIEGLAYTSLKSDIKEKLAHDRPFLKTLLHTTEEHPAEPEIVIGGLSVISNLTHYSPVLSDEQKKMLDLKAYANASKPAEPDPLENDEHVKARCSAVMEAGAIPLLVQLNKSNSSATAHLSDQILLSLSRNSKDRGKMAQQGAVKLLISHALQANNTPPTPSITKQSSLQPALDAAHALARVLISLDPALVLPSNTSPHITDAVQALAPLLKHPSDSAPTLSSSSPRDLLPVFEGLLALTNLASSPDASAANAIIRTCFDEIEDLLLSSNDMVRRAATELICNLVAYPSGVGKFADGSRRSKERLKILVAMADVEDVKTRLAAGGGLAMLTEYEPVITTLLGAEDGGRRMVEVVLDMAADPDPGLVHRGLAVLVNLVHADGKLGGKACELVKSASVETSSAERVASEEIIKEALRRSGDQNILQIGVDVLKKLKGVS